MDYYYYYNVKRSASSFENKLKIRGSTTNTSALCTHIAFLIFFIFLLFCKKVNTTLFLQKSEYPVNESRTLNL